MNSFKEDVNTPLKMPWRNITPSTQKLECEKMLKDSLEIIRTKTIFNDLAMLDAKMMYVISSKTELNELANDFRKVILDGLRFMQRPAIAQMTYEDIILANPQNDIRTFTNGKTGLGEALFYRGNQAIEGHLNDVIESLKNADKYEDIMFLDTACQILQQAWSTLESIRTSVDPSDYEAFRIYFDANPITGEKGPSGLFTATIPHIDILLNGWDNYKDRDHLIENVAYFPQRDMFHLRQSLNDKINLSERFAGQATPTSQLQTIERWLRKFCSEHKKSMRDESKMTL